MVKIMFYVSSSQPKDTQVPLDVLITEERIQS